MDLPNLPKEDLIITAFSLCSFSKCFEHEGRVLDYAYFLYLSNFPSCA